MRQFEPQCDVCTRVKVFESHFIQTSFPQIAKCSQVFMVRSLVELSENSRGAVLRHCPAGLDADLAEYLAGRQLPVPNSTDNSPSDGADGDSASGEDEFDEGYLDSVYKHNYYKKRMCRFGSQCWRPHCWFRHGNGDRMKQIVKMAHYWTQEVKRLSACTVATETVYRANIDVIQSDTATAPVDPSLAAPSAATASPSTPVSVFEHATLAPVDVYTRPAPVIDLMPTPVIEHIAPSAVSDSTILPSFDQIHEAVTDMSVPSVRQQGNVQEIPGIQVVKRIQKQIVETIPQERVQRTVDQNACVSVPTVQEQVIVQGIPELQVVEQTLEQAVEAMQVKLL